jgi:phosphate transport system permease protein
MPDSLFSPGRTLSLHVFTLANEGMFVDQAYATAVILLLLVLGLNALSTTIERRFKQRLK